LKVSEAGLLELTKQDRGKICLFYLKQKDGATAVSKIPVFVPPDHMLCVPGERTYYQPDTALYLTSVAGQ
ncbi:hypothetical protein XENOCAPTIV_014985, partial [Xenoophorus captivus]